MSNTDVYIGMTDVYIWADKNHLGCTYCPCKQSAFTLSLVCLQIPRSFVEDNARNCLRKVSGALQESTGSDGACGSRWTTKYGSVLSQSMRAGCTEIAARQLWEYHQCCLLSCSKCLWWAGSINGQPLQCSWEERGSPAGLYGYPFRQGLVPCVSPFAFLLVPLFTSFCLNSQSPSERHHACCWYGDSLERCQYVSPWIL